MIVVGIGFLLAFLKDYALSSVSYNFLGAILTMEWSMLVIGFSKPQCVVGIPNYLYRYSVAYH